jgi:hypothetical protein
MPAEKMDTLRNAALLAGVSVEGLLRAHPVRDMSRLVVAGIGLISAATVVALIHFGADVRGGFAAGPSGLLPSLVQMVAGEEEGLAILRSERDASA